MGRSQRDNSRLDVKLALRRYFLDRYHTGPAAAPIQVLDCCQGDGALWRTLRTEFPVASYWGLDRKAKPGRLRMDSQRLLGQAGWTATVVDIDTYGSPWGHWAALLPHAPGSVTVFLTVGQAGMGTDRAVVRALGIPFRLSPGLARHVLALGERYLLARAWACRFTIREARQAGPYGVMRYLGLRLERTDG